MTIPTIPDNSNKIFLIISIIIMYLVYVKVDNNITYISNKTREINDEIRNLNVEIRKANNEIDLFYEEAEIYSRANGIENPDNYTILSYNSDNLSEKEKKDEQHLYDLSQKNRRKSIELKSLQEKIEYKKDELHKIKINDRKTYYILIIVTLCAILLFYHGLKSLIKENKLEYSLKNSQKFNSNYYCSNCQSCGKKFNSLVKHAKNSSNEINNSFCTTCMKHDSFTKKYSSVEDVIKEVNSNKKIDKFRKTRIINDIKKLDRWNNDPY